ncbi:MAG TPA: hypothetical protein VE974_06110 [Thermoanaerobaculia bacterium]|nr:hypothetical protein [Thermoanaerobaculia bacterium]
MNPEVDPNLPTQTDEQTEPVAPQPVIEPTVPEIPPTLPVVEPPKDDIDYKAKFSASTTENQILAARLAELENPRKELTNEPTDSDLQAAFPEWEVMTDTERKLARRTFATERLTTSLLTEREQEKATQRWNTDLELAIASNPSLQGKEQAFKEFAKKPTHKGAPLPTLVSAFLYEGSSTTTTPPAPKAPGLLPGNGGPRGPEKTKLMSGSELKTLRETDYKKYKEYIDTHDTSELDV